MADVLVLHSTLGGPRDGPRAAALLARLPYARRLELERRDPAARNASLAGTSLVLTGAARLRGGPVAARELRFEPGSAPDLTGGPGFSVSHSPGRVAVAFSTRFRVGLDLEEAAAATAAAGTFAGSLERWTAIEAVLKACGLGLRATRRVRLADDLSRAEVDGLTLWLRRLGLGAGCTAFLATSGEVASVAVEQLADPW
jgi:phosphopantetheinyl transferase